MEANVAYSSTIRASIPRSSKTRMNLDTCILEPRDCRGHILVDCTWWNVVVDPGKSEVVYFLGGNTFNHAIDKEQRRICHKDKSGLRYHSNSQDRQFASLRDVLL
jgi:hypothetical protein